MTKINSRKIWDDKLHEAQVFMQSRSHQHDAVLIEVATQHPLVGGEKPNQEFTKRLLMAKQLYDDYREQGRRVEIAVLGSRHRQGSKVDKISLSAAGIKFLLDQGVPQEDIRGQDLIDRYKGDAGVYNSADECFVVAAYFKDGQFGELAAVVSPVQLMRKALVYIWQGTLPLFHTAPAANTYHNWIDQAWKLIPYTLHDDPNWQGTDSFQGNKSRRLRRAPE